LVYRPPEYDHLLPLLPWSDLIDLLDDDRQSSCFTIVELGIAQFYSHNAKWINMTLAALTHLLDKNEGLKRLREKEILLYESYDYRTYWQIVDTSRIIF